MKIDLTFAELHHPLFLGGTNWQLKLQEKTAKGHLTLVYDRSEKELLVKFNEHIAIIPTTNVACMHPKLDSIKPIEEKKHNTQPNPKITAQVGSPMDHVFAGPGKGKA
jgi:hypothetical protein